MSALSWGNREGALKGLNKNGTRSDLWVRKVLLDSLMSLSGREGPTYIAAASPFCAPPRFAALAKCLNRLSAPLPTGALPFKAWLVSPSSRNSSLAPRTDSLLPTLNPRFLATHPMARATQNVLPCVTNSRSTRAVARTKTLQSEDPSSSSDSVLSILWSSASQPPSLSHTAHLHNRAI